MKYKTTEQEMAQIVLRVTDAIRDMKDIGCPDHVGTYLTDQGTYLLKNALSGRHTARPSDLKKVVKALYPVSIVLFVPIKCSPAWIS